MGNNSWVKLGNHVESISKTFNFQGVEKVIFLNTSDIFDGRVINHYWTDVSTLPGQAKKTIQKGDVLFSEIRPANRRFAFIDFDADQYVVSTKLMVLRGKETIFPRYLYLNLTNRRTLAWLQYLAESRSGTFPQITFDQIRDLSIYLPAMEDQKAISAFIGALDDKIELNRKMNQTLEEMARAIFKSWFIDFDPVRYKAAGQQPPGLASHIAGLFPDRLVDSELGQVPEGWTVDAFKSEYNLVMGQSPPGSTYNEQQQGICFFQGRRDFGTRFPNRRVYCTAPTRFANEGDTLVSVRAPVGDINLACERCCIGRGVAAVRHKSGSRSYTYYSMLAKRDTLSQFEAEGTVFGSISKKGFETLRVLCPPWTLIHCLEKILFPLDERILINHRQSVMLQDIRDTLLPKLISGELRVPDAERIVERAL